MNCIVTGGAGFIGSHVTESLLNTDHKVIVIDDFSLGKEENLAHLKENKNLTIVKRSITENLLDILTPEINAIFHLAALPRVQFSIQYPQETHHVNINGTLNLLEACRKAGIKRFIFSSSSAIYGNQEKLPIQEEMKPLPLSPYALQKLAGEYYCKLYQEIYGLETISLRYFNVYGPRQNTEGTYANLIPKCISLVEKNTPPQIYGNGEQTRDFIFVSDVVDANLLAAAAKNQQCFGEAFNIGSGKNFSVKNVIEEIVKRSRKKIIPLYNPPVIEPRDTLAGISKAKELLSWEPKISFEKGIEETYRFFSKKERNQVKYA